MEQHQIPGPVLFLLYPTLSPDASQYSENVKDVINTVIFFSLMRKLENRVEDMRPGPYCLKQVGVEEP